MMKKTLALLTSLFAVVVFVGCGDDGGDDSDDGSEGGSGSSTECSSFHECINGACECTTEGKEGQSCSEDTCEDECEVCN
ncbi:MAG: hypothetical protein HOW73_15750 [Polyangiaceae bacterium]|nr:hypothetical protein [Polyangiaceae bacterium]